MTTTKHTPRETAYGYGVLIRCGKTLVFVPAENDESMDAVDLIQAAPRLLEACKGLLDMLAEWDSNGDGLSGFEDFAAVNEARETIANAEPIV